MSVSFLDHPANSWRRTSSRFLNQSLWYWAGRSRRRRAPPLLATLRVPMLASTQCMKSTVLASASSSDNRLAAYTVLYRLSSAPALLTTWSWSQKYDQALTSCLSADCGLWAVLLWYSSRSKSSSVLILGLPTVARTIPAVATQHAHCAPTGKSMATTTPGCRLYSASACSHPHVRVAGCSNTVVQVPNQDSSPRRNPTAEANS